MFLKSNETLASFFKNKLIIITGGGSGLGQSLASLLCCYGARVIIVGRNPIKLQQTQTKVLAEHPNAFIRFQQLDICHYDEMEHFFKAVFFEHGSIHGVFANAAQVFISDFNSIPIKKIQNILTTNINGTIYTAKVALPYLCKNNSFIAFTTGLAGYSIPPESSIYATSKAAVITFSRILRQELSSSNTHILTFSPGFIDTDFKNGATATPFLLPVKTAATRYLKAVHSKKEEVALPISLLIILLTWKYLSILGIGTPLFKYGTKKLYRYYGNNAAKHKKLRDSFGFRRLICGISFNKAIANWLHNKFHIIK